MSSLIFPIVSSPDRNVPFLVFVFRALCLAFFSCWSGRIRAVGLGRSEALRSTRGGAQGKANDGDGGTASGPQGCFPCPCPASCRPLANSSKR